MKEDLWKEKFEKRFPNETCGKDYLDNYKKLHQAVPGLDKYSSDTKVYFTSDKKVVLQNSYSLNTITHPSSIDYKYHKDGRVEIKTGRTEDIDAHLKSLKISTVPPKMANYRDFVLADLVVISSKTQRIHRCSRDVVGVDAMVYSYQVQLLSKSKELLHSGDFTSHSFDENASRKQFQNSVLCWFDRNQKMAFLYNSNWHVHLVLHNVDVDW